MKTTSLLAACGLACGGQAAIAQGETPFTVAGPTLYMNGEIYSDTGQAFDAVIAANPQITTLVQCEVLGSNDDDAMIALAYRLRALGLNTHLTATSEIASGGVDLFLAGVSRTMEQGAAMGVHSWSDGQNDAADFPRSAPEHDANSDYIADMLGDDAFYWFTIHAAAAADMHWMSPAEIATYSLLTAPVITGAATYVCP